MFWDSVLAGLRVLLYWETYIASVVYLAIFVLPTFLFGFWLQRKGEDGFGKIGCLMMIGMPFVQALAVLIFVLIMSPIILGFGENGAWGLPILLFVAAPGTLLKATGFTLLFAVGFSFLPVIGRWDSAVLAASGTVALVLVLGMLETMQPGLVGHRVHLWPGILPAFGFLVIGGLAAWVGTVAASVLSTKLQERLGEITQIIVMPLGSVFGFLPLFIYGGFLSLQLRIG